MKQLLWFISITSLVFCLSLRQPPATVSEGNSQEFVHDAEIVSSPYLTFGDYGVHLGNFAAPDVVSGDYVAYDQRWFEMLTSSMESRLSQSLQQTMELDRFLFYASRSMANHIRALASLIVADNKRTEVKSTFDEILSRRSFHQRKVISEAFIAKMQNFVSQASTPKAIIEELKDIETVNGPFENALLERIWLHLGMVQYTSVENYRDFLVYSLRLLEQFAKNRSVAIHLTPDHSKLLGTIINTHCLRSAKETQSTKFFFSLMSRDRKDLFVNLLYFLNVTPDGLKCVQETVSEHQSDLLLQVPADSFFPRVNYPPHPRVYFVHSPTYNTHRSTNIGMFTFSSSWDTDVLPGSAGRVVVGNNQSKKQRIKIILTHEENLSVTSGFKTGIVCLRENSRRELILILGETQMEKGKQPVWSALLNDVHRGDIFVFWNAEVDSLPDNIEETLHNAWTGTRREILLHVAASFKFSDFIHAILIENQPRPHKN